MAAEYRPTLEQAVDTLINGPVEARISQVQPKPEGFATRLRRWTVTPFRRLLPGQHLSVDTPPVGPPSRLAAEKRTRLNTEVYAIYQEIISRQGAYSPDDPHGAFKTEIPLNPDDRPVDLKVGQSETGSLISVNIAKQTLRAGEITLITLTPNELSSIIRTTFYDNGHPEVKDVRPYSPIQDLEALKIVGEFAKQRQWAGIIGEE